MAEVYFTITIKFISIVEEVYSCNPGKCLIIMNKTFEGKKYLNLAHDETDEDDDSDSSDDASSDDDEDEDEKNLDQIFFDKLGFRTSIEHNLTKKQIL